MMRGLVFLAFEFVAMCFAAFAAFNGVAALLGWRDQLVPLMPYAGAALLVATLLAAVAIYEGCKARALYGTLAAIFWFVIGSILTWMALFEQRPATSGFLLGSVILYILGCGMSLILAQQILRRSRRRRHP